MGFGRESSTFGIDIAYQPICSHTWQEAESRIETPGGFLETDERTIANHFAFSNAVLCSGMTQQLRHFGLQIAIEARSCAQHIEQDDHPEGTSRDQDEAWQEWKPAIGTRVRFDNIDLQRTTRVTTGTGFPGVDDPVLLETATALASPDFIAALRDPLTLHDAPGLDPRSGPVARVPARTGPGPLPRLCGGGLREPGSPELRQKVQTSGITIMTTTKTTAVSGSPTRR